MGDFVDDLNELDRLYAEGSLSEIDAQLWACNILTADNVDDVVARIPAAIRTSFIALLEDEHFGEEPFLTSNGYVEVPEAAREAARAWVAKRAGGPSP